MVDQLDIAMLQRMRRSRIGNYVLPGLTSWIIGAPHDGGCVRMFSSEREQQECITPHSHRFEFQCLVLRGRVMNRVWNQVWGDRGDRFATSRLVYDSLGHYEKHFVDVRRFEFADHIFTEGMRYSMTANEIHSIYFGARTEVLFFEGPSVSNQSTILEPYVDDEIVPTFEVRPWMFKKEPS
ncbi:hypothetical protein D3C86_1395340 [compost metagenome]